MKIRRLSEIDLAKFVALPAGPKLENALRSYNAGGGSWSYEPVRASTSDVLGVATPLYGAVATPSLEIIEEQIRRACRRGEVQIKSNTEVARLLYHFSRNADWKSVAFIMRRMPIGFSESVRFWSDIVVSDENGLFIPFFDHRRAGGLSSNAARQIVFSMQHHWLRERHPDLDSARLAIVRFPCSRDHRSIQIDFHTEDELLTFEELDARVRTVYETWSRVSSERRAEAKTGTDNPFRF